MSEAHFELPTKTATIELAARLSRVVAAGDLVVLSGPLGSGKTFLVRALCRALGLPRDVRVTSPTFTLVHEYDLSPPVRHADLYRLADDGQVRMLGLDAFRDEGCLLLVEWGEAYVDVLGGDALHVTLSTTPRRALLSATGPRSKAILSVLEAPSRVEAPSMVEAGRGERE